MAGGGGNGEFRGTEDDPRIETTVKGTTDNGQINALQPGRVSRMTQEASKNQLASTDHQQNSRSGSSTNLGGQLEGESESEGDSSRVESARGANDSITSDRQLRVRWVFSKC